MQKHRLGSLLAFSTLLLGLTGQAYAQVTTVAGQSDCSGYDQSVCRFATTGMAYDATTGGYYVGEKTQLVLRYIASNGIVTTLPSAMTGLKGVSDVAVDANGIAYVADNYGCTIWSIQAGGWTRIAGTGVCGYSGDGGPAAAAQMSTPVGIAVSPNGAIIYVSESGSHKIRKLTRVGVDYMISTIAGNWSGLVPPDVGDGRPAIAAKLANPRGLALDSLGRLWIADSSNQRVRRIGVDGVIISVAGTGIAGTTNDGGSPTDTRLSNPTDVVLASDSVAYIADAGSSRIRRLIDGISLTTVAGSVSGYLDNADPLAAQFRGPQSIVLQPNGDLQVGDTDNLRIRRVRLSAPSPSLTPIPVTPTRTSTPTSTAAATLTNTSKPTVTPPPVCQPAGCITATP